MAPGANLWQDMTRGEIAAARDRGALAVVPVGAVEQHGEHLPVDTDARLSTAVARQAAARTSEADVLVLPTLPFGFSPHHLSHAGTVSLRLSTFLGVLGDIATSLAETGFGRIVFVNGHGGNAAPLRAAVAELVSDGVPAVGVDYWVPADAEWIAMLRGVSKRFGHACEFETSLMMAVGRDDPEYVRRIAQRARGLPARPAQPFVVDTARPDAVTGARAAWPPLFQNDDVGYQGDPGAASLEAGVAILDLLADRLARFLDDFAAMPIRVGRTRPGEPPRVAEPVAPSKTSSRARGAGRNPSGGRP